MDNQEIHKGVIIAGAGRGLWLAKLIGLTAVPPLPRRVVAVVEPNTAAQPELRERLDSYHMQDTAICNSLLEAFARFSPAEADSVLLVTPNTTHADLLDLCLQNDRHVFLEKPVSASWPDAVRIANAVKNSSKLVMLGFVLRYSHFYQKAKEICDSGVLGQVVMLQMNERIDLDHSSVFRRGWRRNAAASGGFMNEKCSHDLDLMCFLKEKQAVPVALYSYAGQELFPPKPDAPAKCRDCADADCPYRFDLSRLHNREFNLNPNIDEQEHCIFNTRTDVYNHQSATVIFSDGTQAIFTTLAASAAPGRDLLIHGTAGMLSGSLESHTLKLVEYRNMQEQIINAKPGVGHHDGADEAILREFFDCIDHGHTPTSRVIDGINASRLAFASDLSVREKRRVELSELPL